ncbi:mucin-binding protein [Limosilactobacillus mucosae]|uniref:mucin-binding protein n=1 Tax=uncultured Limosilactobacillus sp. TaxID=2837629 RepID=UPI00338D3EC1
MRTILIKSNILINTNGTVKTVAQSVTISRPVQVDKAIGTKVYGQWSQAAWQAVQVPDRAGYSPNQAVIAARVGRNAERLRP